MAIKIYQSQIRPTAEVKERASTGRMQMSLSEAQAPGKALQGMLEAGENLYVAYEKQKSENEVIEAAKEIKINVPLVVRLAGTNFLEGKKILDNSGLKLISAENLGDAAKKIVEAIK